MAHIMPKTTLITYLISISAGFIGSAIYLITNIEKFSWLTSVKYVTVGTVAAVVSFSIYSVYFDTVDYQLAVTFTAGFIAYPFFQSFGKAVVTLLADPFKLLDIWRGK